MSSERTLVFVPVLAALALSCSGGEPTPPVVGTPAVTHLLDHRAHSIEVAGSGLPAAVEVALSDELVWMRGERLTDLDWFLDRSASTEGAEIAARATPRFTPAGPARLVTWGELDDPEAGHRPGTDDPPGLSRGTVLINARVRGTDGLTAWARARGRPFRQQLLGFGEAVLYKYPTKGPRHNPTGNMGAIGGEGIFVGYDWQSDTFMVETEDGPVRARSVTRRPGGERWRAREDQQHAGSTTRTS